MLYCSSRGGDRDTSFEDVLLATYCSDGGLFVPQSPLPLLLSETLLSWAHRSYSEVCAEILHMFSGFDKGDLNEMTRDAFAKFNVQRSGGGQGEGHDPIPLRKFSDSILLDLSLGPTFAFKDVGQQMVNKLINYVLSRRHAKFTLENESSFSSGKSYGKLTNTFKKANIVVETSGDTGPAAIHGALGCSHVNIYCLYPNNRVSTVQELQMVTIDAPNVHIYRTDGDTDEQASVLKELFSDRDYVKEFNICSVNSINWVRICTQSSYYVWAYLQVYNNKFTFGKEIDFFVPTGAFGNAMGAYLAKLMGVPIGKIFCATNSNDIVHRSISRGDLSMVTSLATVSPAMDIQFAYNLERMLYFICNQNPAIVGDVMRKVEFDTKNINKEANNSANLLDSSVITRIQSVFHSQSISDELTIQTIQDFQARYDFTLCPHSAVGVAAYNNQVKAGCVRNLSICVLTAHPSKFESAVRRALGRDPVFPEAVTLLRNLPQRFKTLTKSSSENTTLDSSWRQEWIASLKNDIQKHS